MKKQLQNFINDESGATAIEYGLLAALISVGIAVAAGAVGDKLADVFTFIEGKLTEAVPAATP